MDYPGSPVKYTVLELNINGPRLKIYGPKMLKIDGPLAGRLRVG